MNIFLIPHHQNSRESTDLEDFRTFWNPFRDSPLSGFLQERGPFCSHFCAKKVHFREFRAHFRIIVFIRCAFLIHCCSILATKRPSARPFGPPSESVLNRDSFRNVVIFGQKGTFLGIPCSCPNASFLGGQRLLGDFCR